MTDKRIAVILPCYNEIETIDKVISDWREAVPEALICVGDNNSTDGSGDVAAAAGAMVFKEFTPGKGAVIKTLLRQIDADVYVMCDADDTYPATRDVLLPVLNGDADICIGDRLDRRTAKERGVKFLNRFGNYVFQLLCRIFIGKKIRDPLSGLRVFTKEFIDGLVLSDGFEIEMEMNKHIVRHGRRVAYVPIDYKVRDHGVSKLSAFADGWKILKVIFRRNEK